MTVIPPLSNHNVSHATGGGLLDSVKQAMASASGGAGSAGGAGAAAGAGTAGATGTTTAAGGAKGDGSVGLFDGVLLKMGGYGILRFCLQLTPAASAQFLPIFAIFGAINVLYGGLCALRQSDVKVMIAYSSVSHMGMFYLGIGCSAASAPFNQYGVLGAQFQLFSHGVITALLFAVAGAVYNKTHSRDLRAWGGLGARAPVYTFFYVLAAMGSLGLPGMTGFWAEFMVLFGTWGSHWMLAVLAVPGLLITTMFLLRSVQYGFFGPLNPDHLTMKDADWWELVAFLMLGSAALWFGVIPSALTSTVLPILPALIGGTP